MTKKTILSIQPPGGNTTGTFKPQLTSLIDVMTILLVFLIKSFSVEGNLITQSDNLTLPVSTSNIKPEPVTTIEISKSTVMAGGTVLAKHETFSASDSMMIPKLFDWMTNQNPSATSIKSSEVMIQSDRDVEFNILKRVMYTCSKAGFSDFSILVLEES